MMRLTVNKMMGVAMGSALFLVVVPFYMESFKLLPLSWALLHPLHYFHYVDDTFVL